MELINDNSKNDMKTIYFRMAGAAVITAVMMASCSDVVDIPQHDPYASNGAPVIEAIYDAQDASATSSPFSSPEGLLLGRESRLEI